MACNLEKPILGAGVNIMLMPPTTPISNSLFFKPEHATCKADIDEEHAVSMARQGPSKPNVYEIRPQAVLMQVPVREYASI